MWVAVAASPPGSADAKTGPAGANGPLTWTPTSTLGTSSLYSMMLCPCVYSPSRAPPRRKPHTLSSIGPHVFENSAHVVAAATTAVGVGSTVFAVTSTGTPQSVRPAVVTGT